MKKREGALVLLTLLSCFVSLVGAASPEAVVGRWSGVLHDSGNTVSVGFEFKNENNELQASFFCDDWDLKGVPIGKASLTDNEVKTVLFTGTLTGGARMSGNLDFGPMGVPDLKLPLALEKTAETTPVPPEKTTFRQVNARWSFPTQAEVWSSPTVAQGVLYVGSDDGFLYALDARTGSQKWRFQAGKGIRSKPAVGSEAVCFLSDDGYLYALDRTSGKLKWKFDTHTALVPHTVLGDNDSRWDYLQSSPAIADGLVFVGSGNSNFYAVDMASGQEKWHYTAGDSVRSSPRVVGNTVFFASWDNFVYALNAATGEEKWKFDTKGIVQASPIVAGDVLVIGSRYPYVFALDATTGQEKWRFNYFGSWVESSAVVDSSTVYVGSSDFLHLFAIDLKNGQRKWGFKTSGYSWSSPAIANGTVYIGAARSTQRHSNAGGDLYAVDAKTGREVWRFQTGRLPDHFLQGVVSSPVVADGLVYFGALDGRVYAVPAS
ncbi:MAG: hypothetical protein EHM18_12890 [Acidobacteria bacterium]|nr:MAG: hypothetical protein EHM18_12890 [Acidobacteriota bacterium]